MPPGVMGPGDQLVGQKLAGSQNTDGRSLDPSLTSLTRGFSPCLGLEAQRATSGFEKFLAGCHNISVGEI